MSPTEIALLATLRAPVVRLERICEEYLGVGYERAKQLAALHRLPVPVFKLHDSERAPYLIGVHDLAAYIDATRDRARESWQHSQL